MRYSLVLIFTFAMSAVADVVRLTADNYDIMTAGKTVFIKFFATWCGACKKLAPDWERLGEEWSEHSNGLIAEIDCSGDGELLCKKHMIRGYPTLKFGDPTDPFDYDGERDFNSLNSFAKEYLKPFCSPDHLELCDEEMKAAIEKYQSMSKEELAAAIDVEEERIFAAYEKFIAMLDRVYPAQEKLRKENDGQNGKTLALMKAVKKVAAAKAT